MLAYFIMKGNAECQHKDDDFTKSKQIYKDQYRFCTTFYSPVSAHLLMKNRIEVGYAIHQLQVMSAALHASFYLSPSQKTFLLGFMTRKM